jgi:hypothetical protein
MAVIFGCQATIEVHNCLESNQRSSQLSWEQPAMLLIAFSSHLQAVCLGGCVYVWNQMQGAGNSKT